MMRVRILADAKLNTIAGRISSALVDSSISNQMFKVILDEFAKFSDLKDDVTRGSQKAYKAVEMDDKTKY